MLQREATVKRQHEATAPRPERPRVLIVDDDAYVLRAHERLLSLTFDTVVAKDGENALEMLSAFPVEAVVSDITMPGLDGLSLLRRVRERDLDLPVIFVTGEPTIARAAQAVEYGAFRFVPKPADPDMLIRTVTEAIAFGRAAKTRREILTELQGSQSGDRTALEVCFDRAMGRLWIAFQPIIRWSTQEIYAYEALVRCTEPAMPHPGALLDAAERLNRMRELGRQIRAITGPAFGVVKGDTRLFANLHVSDLTDELLLSADGPFREITGRTTLEITERASLSTVDSVRERLRALREKGYGIALDDLGAGYAGLSSFALLEPDVIKLDMSLVRNLHNSPTKQKLVASMLGLCRDLQREVVAEGVETVDERDVLLDLGCDLLQGYLLGRPAALNPA